MVKPNHQPRAHQLIMYIWEQSALRGDGCIYDIQCGCAPVRTTCSSLSLSWCLARSFGWPQTMSSALLPELTSCRSPPCSPPLLIPVGLVPYPEAHSAKAAAASEAMAAAALRRRSVGCFEQAVGWAAGPERL